MQSCSVSNLLMGKPRPVKRLTIERNRLHIRLIRASFRRFYHQTVPAGSEHHLRSFEEWRGQEVDILPHNWVDAHCRAHIPGTLAAHIFIITQPMTSRVEILLQAGTDSFC